MRKSYGKVAVTPQKSRKNPRELDKEFEKVLTIGEGTVDEAKSVFKEEKEAEMRVKDEDISRLFDKRRTFFSYNETLARMLSENLTNDGIPHGWKVKVAHASMGVVLELESPNKRFFRSAFKTTGDPYLDTKALENFTIRAENTMDRIWQKPNAPTTKDNG